MLAARLGVASCALGYLLDATRVGEGRPADLTGGRLTGIEPELGITISTEVGRGASSDEIDRAISAVHVAVEVIDINARFDDLAAVLSGNIWHHSYQLGTTPEPGTDRRLGAESLHEVVRGGPGSPRWVQRQQAAMIACLIEAGAEPDAVATGGVTPLHRAVRNRCAAAVRALLDTGADPHRSNDNGSTAVMLPNGPSGAVGAARLRPKRSKTRSSRSLR